MLVSTEPRAMFQYSAWPIVASLVVLVALIVIYVMMKSKRRPKPLPKVQPVVMTVDLTRVKSEFLTQIDELMRDFQNGQIANRQAYQSLSRLIRQFIHRVTGIKVQNYTLSEIEVLNIPSLTELVAEYYSPEFALDAEGDFLTSAAKTRKVVESWH